MFGDHVLLVQNLVLDILSLLLMITLL